MLINGIELSTLGIELYNRVLYSNDIDTKQEWLDGDIQPTFIRQQDKFKTINLEFLVLEQNEDIAFKKFSRLTAALKQATIKFDDLDFTFDVNLVEAGEPTRLKNGNFIISYVLSSGYAKGQREVYTTNANMTNAFKLAISYYKNSTTLLDTIFVTIRASMFDKEIVTLEDLGIDVNKYRPDYHETGIATNLAGIDLTYDNLQKLQVMVINYKPISYNITAQYFIESETGAYNQILETNIYFTQPQLENFQTIGQLLEVQKYRPDGYKIKVNYDKELNLENLLAFSPISVFYNKAEIIRDKNVIINYKIENDEGEFETINSTMINVSETSLYDGSLLSDIVKIEAHRPNPSYYNSGYIDGHASNELITYDSLELGYSVIYTKAENVLFVEYYAGTYPNWHRLTTTTLTTKYSTRYEQEFNILTDIGLDLEKYHSATYNNGVLYNQDNFDTYDDVLNIGVLQVYYTAIDYPITVNYYTNGLAQEPIVETININALMFFGNPILSDIIPILEHRPEGYQFDEFSSYSGEISLSALTQASPIIIAYKEIEVSRTKNIIVKYKQELSSAYSTINTILITINESDIVGGVRLRDIISLNAYKPEYYEDGVIDGASSTAVTQYEDIGSEYTVLYMAKTYTTPVRYYLDEVTDNNWIGSSLVSYRVIDFTTSTTLFDLGLSLNMFKPPYGSDGEILYTGPINFTSLLETESINILYTTISEPEDPDGIKYPHRFLFLQHNDLGEYEHLHPEWTMNHAYINTGISADDMSKLTVVMECDRTDPNVPLYQVNAGQAYLFGSSSPSGSFYMRYNNQTMYGENLSGINLFEAKAGEHSNVLSLAESSAVGFSNSTGIYSSAQEGYSRAVFTYSHTLATDGASMPYPLYLFAINNNGKYKGGLGGIGIYSCRIYYNDQLIRDFIPVQFYDKIGDKVAPSNCLYDKITETFFEDATGLNSFNIRDDERYIDTELSHKIGYAYVNYYKGEDLIKTQMVYFRGDDFGEDKNYDIYENFQVDANQPDFCKSGVIRNIETINVSFDGLNNKEFTVYYEPIETMITVNYYQEENGIQHLLASEEIALQENDFYQAPSFGDLVRLNKYKPDGYETNFVYEGKRVTLKRVVEGSPYNIVYTKMKEDPVLYSTTIRFIKKVYGVRNYETIKEEIITLDQSNFREGEYIDFYIDKNKYKPDKYYKDGETYQWFEMDEILDKPENLKELYSIVYYPEPQTIDINYYTDEVHEDNLIASSSWEIQIDDLDPRLTYSVIEILPNSYINKFKPIVCNGGAIQNGELEHTFESLVTYGHIDILYETIVEPDDPEEAYYERKILYFGKFKKGIPTDMRGGPTRSSTLENGGIIPYIDLGYKPKELGRLKAEIKAVAQSNGFKATTTAYAWQDTSYVDFFGYKVPRDHRTIGDVNGVYEKADWGTEKDLGDFYSVYIPNYNKGHFSFSTRVAVATNWTSTSAGPQSLDGQLLYAASSTPGIIKGSPLWIYYGNNASFRRGMAEIYDENWEVIDCYKKYGFDESREINKNWVINEERYPDIEITALANPVTTILDAYNGYWSSYTNEDSNHAPYEFFENTDEEIFEAKLQPKGSLSLFRTTNPLTGKVNIMPFYLTARLNTGGTGTGLGLKGGNPYTGNYKTVEIQVLMKDSVSVDGTSGEHEEQVNWVIKKIERNINYTDFTVPIYPQLEACAIWGVKIWDRDRLVRDLIPVEKGDKIYDYIMPETGMFDLVTEIFFGNSNNGGEYEITSFFADEQNVGNKDKDDPYFKLATKKITIKPEDVLPLKTMLDPGYYGTITMNYYNYDYSFIANQFVPIPTWYSPGNTTFAELTGYNDFKPSDYYLDGFLDIDNPDSPVQNNDVTLKELYDMKSANVYYKLKTFTKTIVYYQDNYRVGSKDIFYSLEDIENAKTLTDLGIDLNLYQTEDFSQGKLIFNENIIAEGDIQAFIDAPSPIVVYEKLSKEEAPNLLYVEYYRGGAYDDTLITPDPNDENYFDCDLDGVVLNPNGAIKYYNHYHSALYEDEKFDYFIPYQVRVLNKFIGIHRGPARKFPTLATIVEKPTLTIVEERNGWGRLKEYPVGWIMLNATEPIVGPGQNPDYDVPDAETATIPFATEVHITKLTVDRLWCYVPEVESWVKAEDISYNQSGKLYNALNLKVIHLDEIDFSQVTNTEDIGIYPNLYNLYFHNLISYDYQGEYTYEAFSNIHEIDFVYPETIYNYSCIYYKDHAQPWTVGEGEALCNPPTETGKVNIRPNPSYTDAVYAVPKGGILVLTGQPITNDEGTWYPVQHTVGQTVYEGYMDVLYLNIVREPADEIHQTDSELGRASFTCSISDWNPDWDTFIATSWKIDENEKSIPPTLYRGTNLTLTWDYFGFDKNLYKPEGYSDGIYLWNPRTWNSNGDIQFTFYELVRCGTQRVVYPCINPDIYKVWVYPNQVGVKHWSNGTTYTSNPGYPLRLGSKNNDRIYDDNSLETGALDIHVEFETAPSGLSNRTHLFGGAKIEINSSTNTTSFKGPQVKIKKSGTSGTLNPTIHYYWVLQDGAEYITLPGGAEYCYSWNWSDFRDYGLYVNGVKNNLEGQKWDYYIPDTNSEKVKITNSLNLKNYTLERNSDEKYNGLNEISYDRDKWNVFAGILHKIQSYENFEMIHYWTPVPKGLWYIFNGEERRIPDDGMFDILTGEFIGGYKQTYGSSADVGPDSSGSYHPVTPIADGKNLIFLTDTRVNPDQPFNYFDEWYYESSDIDYIAQINSDIADSYVQPDIYATKKRRLQNGLILPISKVTSDINNKVVGEWYYSSDQWFETKWSNLYVGEFDKNKLVKHTQPIALVKPTDNKKYYVYLNPAEVSSPGEQSNVEYDNKGQVITTYYNYVDKNNNKYYFDGNMWIPEYYTAFNTIEHNKNYAVIPNSLNYYSQPIDNEIYIEDAYHYGDRVTVLYVSAQDPEWGFTGLGWVKVNTSNLSEVL